uniref:Phosphoglycerate mutase (2,3-diphosphoglycerate-dependent) n=1 Tax=Ditylum brightwellii TaxID=49249 RepID=A0A7S1ZIU3_9STRA|mmetsp:Transcript_32786/g.48820  ORF Transcript_32786/g.48820 Transcript_32786/m.48820 type:complete len:325 (+) Transcript_32786:22-996(+)
MTTFASPLSSSRISRKVNRRPASSSFSFFFVLMTLTSIPRIISAFTVIRTQPLTPLSSARMSASLFMSTKSASSSEERGKVEIVSEMPDPLPPLKNSFYLLRHGQSTANVEGIISSARSLAGSTKHGLTNLGYQQGKESADSLLDLISKAGEENKRVFFYSSPFARAKETAEACLDGLKEKSDRVKELNLDVQSEILFEDNLMERYFGRLDGKELLTYAYVWPVDMFEPTHTAFDVESVAAVSTRIRDVLIRIDESSIHDKDDDIIVLVSHADVLQITQVYAAGLDNVGKFSQYRFGNGEVRAMGRTVDTLPEAAPLMPPKRGT